MKTKHIFSGGTPRQSQGTGKTAENREKGPVLRSEPLPFRCWGVWPGNGRDGEYVKKLVSKLFDSLELKILKLFEISNWFLAFKYAKENRLGNGAEKKIKGLCGWVEGGMEQREKEIGKQKKKPPTCWKREYRVVSKGTTLILGIGCFANS